MIKELEKQAGPFLNKVASDVEGHHVLVGEAVSGKYASDWTSAESVRPVAVFRPDSTEAVSGIMKNATQFDQPIVVQGGLTGLVGGAAPQLGEIGLSLERMNHILDVDTNALTMTVEAGVTLEAVQTAARDVGLLFPLDLGARGSCTIGGNISTNAGGNQVIRYGSARNLVLGLEAVLPDGTIISALNRLIKNNAGFDLKHLLIGTEGVLGIITKAVLRLYPQPKSRITTLVALNSFSHCVDLLNTMQSRFSDALNSFEVMWDDYYQTSIAHTENLNNPFDTTYRFYALVEVCGNDAAYDRSQLDSVLSEELEQGAIANAVVAESTKQSTDLWRIRDGIGQLMDALQYPVNFDIGLPLQDMESFVDKVIAHLKSDYSNPIILPFGHIGDGNIHLTVATGNQEDVSKIYDTIYRMCESYHSTISAEHGIGITKKSYLSVSRSAEEIELMKKLKVFLDPCSVLNRGRII